MTTIAAINHTQAARFAEDGFTVIPDLISSALALAARDRALAWCRDPQEVVVPTADAMFHQLINVWQVDPLLRSLSLSPRLLDAVIELSGGRPMRLFHDQLFVKPGPGSVATEFHQDLPYWPVPPETETISAWIALGDITSEQGCLTFIPGSHRLRGAASDLRTADSLVSLYPELTFAERVTVPLRAGGATLHRGYAAHRAGPNLGTDSRVALSVIFIPRDTRCTGDWHVLTQRCGLVPGEVFPDACCPPIS